MAKSNKQSTRLNHKFYQSVIQIACMGLLMVASTAKAELVITYDATEESERTGFFDDGAVTSAELGDNTGTTIGEARRIVVETAVAYWNANLEVNSEISFGVKFGSLTCAASGYVVGSTTSYSNYYGDDSIVYPRSLYYNLTGSSGTAMDLKFNSNFGSNISTACENASWYYGIEQDKPSSAYVTDLYYTALHEIAHGLGISAKGFQSSTGQFINGSAGGIFVNNLLDTTTNKRWGDADTTDAERLASITNGASTLVWGGAEVKRIADSASLLSSGTTDDYPIMYAPGIYSSGSSLSHFDTSLSYSDLATGTNELMEPFITDSEDDILTGAILTDIGWIVTMDSDGDGTADPSDAFPVSNAADTDVDGDGLPDDWLADCDASCQTASGLTLDDDDDNDSVSDGIDNCPATANTDQGDHDSDGTGDVCDTDGDNDGVLTAVDNCPLGDLGWTSNASNDIDGDGCQDSSAEENDYDNDGVDDSVDSDPNDPNVCSDNDNDGFDDCRTGTYDLDLDSDLDADGADYDEDIDADGDGLIEISTLAQLNAMRNDLAGTSLSGGTIGCNDACNGYELMNDLDFDTDGSGAIDSADDYWNSAKGWEPVGNTSGSFTGTFEGNGHSVSNLYIDRSYSDSDYIGLFGYAVGAEIRNIGLNGNLASITADTSDYVGALVGYSTTTTISNVYSTVDINHSGFGDSIGGLIGKMYEGSLSNAYTSGDIRSAIDNFHYIGGVVGESYNGIISNVYSIASVLENPEDTPNKGGALVGLNTGGGTISDSYWNSTLTPLGGTNDDSNNDIISGITVLYAGLSTTDMQCPQSPSDSACGTATAYQNWDTDNWDFGTDSQYLALMHDGVSLREPDASPVVSAPADQTVEATGSTTTIDLGTATVTDAEDGTLTATADNSGPFAVGVHTITWSATDSAGNTASATQTITITDTTAPTVTAPADVTLEATGVTTMVYLMSATAVDLVDGSLTTSASDTGPYALGTHTITWSATDSVGNTGSDTQTITIQDTTAPTITAPANQTVVATGSTTSVDLGTATSSDLVDSNPTITNDQSDAFSLGTYTIVWTATDASGNFATSNQTITITDPGIPDLIAPSDISVEATGATTTVTFETVSAEDILEGTLIASADNTGPFTVGTHTITWSISNSRNGVSSATQLVTITDTTAPAISVPASINVRAAETTTSVDVGTATATDLVDGSVTVTSDSAGSYAVGTHTVTWTATDSAGNTATSEQTVTVTDSGAPTITAPANQTIEATGVTTAVDIGTATAEDATDGTITAVADKSGPFALGTHTITWSATDNADNTGTVEQTIIVQDTTAPTINAPANQSVSTTEAEAVVTLGTPTVSDIADSNPTTVADKTSPFSVGTHTVTWTATDASGNSATAEQTVTVTDNGAPSITTPSNISKEATGATTSVALGTATATDAVDGTIAATADNSGPFGVGTHTVTWTATDVEGNSASATQTVTITDTTAPQISVPDAIVAQATGETTSVDIGTATATDLVDSAVTTSSNSSGSFTVGTHTVTWTATDNAGNTATAEQTITVTDGEPPVVTAPADITVEATGTTTAVSLGNASATDSVDGDLTTTADNTGPFTVGTHTITWTATDSASNTSSATQSVTIQDTTAPEISVDETILTLNALGVITPVDDFGVSTNDLVDGSVTVTGYKISDSQEPQALSESGFESGIHFLLWQATDSAGNTASVNQTVGITPLANFVTTQAASVGDEVTVTVELSGNAAAYPVTIPYTIDLQASTVTHNGLDHDASNGEITIESGTTGNFIFNVADNPATSEGDIVFQFGSLTNATIGAVSTHKVTVSANNIAPQLEVTMTQAGVAVSQISMDAGNVLINAIASDSTAQTLSYDWSQSDSALADLLIDTDESTFELDPSSLAAGFYTVVVAVSDNGAPIAETTISSSFKVVAGTVAIVDSDLDGIKDDEDNVSEENRLPQNTGDTDSYILESETGTKLRLGSVALEQEKNGAAVDLASLPEIPSEYESAVLDAYDFEISGVAQGESALIVIPQQIAIPANPVYLKSDGTTWKAFVEDDKNALYSAAEISAGVCPTVGDASYTSGLTAGDTCLQLKIEDGGANDTDGLVNGSISDPGVIVSQATSAGTGTNTSSGGGSLSWFMLPLFLLLSLKGYGMARRRDI